MTISDAFLCLGVCIGVSVPLIGPKIVDYVQKKRFERLVDRVGAAR